MAVEQVADPNTRDGFIDSVPGVYGEDVHLTFQDITYAGVTPTNAFGLTFQLLVKVNRDDADVDAIIDFGNSDLVIDTDPLKVGAKIDTTLTGFEEGRTYPGELWVTDTNNSVGRSNVKEFQIVLSDPIKITFP